jgi:hypothetical protein
MRTLDLILYVVAVGAALKTPTSRPELFSGQSRQRAYQLSVSPRNLRRKGAPTRSLDPVRCVL